MYWYGLELSEESPTTLGVLVKILVKSKSRKPVSFYDANRSCRLISKPWSGAYPPLLLGIEAYRDVIVPPIGGFPPLEPNISKSKNIFSSIFLQGAQIFFVQFRRTED